MIGAVIQCVEGNGGRFDPLIYHKFNDRSVLDIIIDSCLMAPHLHEVIISAPLSERKNITGVSIGNQSKLNTNKREFLGRKSSVNYYDQEGAGLTGLYMAALQNKLDYVVRVHANCPLLPSWLINSMVRYYFENKLTSSILTTGDNYDPGFKIDIIPFWIIAEAYIYQEDRSSLDVNKWEPTLFEKLEGEIIPHSNVDLRFDDISKAELFDSMLVSLEEGHDIAELIEINNGNYQENVEA